MKPVKSVKIRNFIVGEDAPLTLFSGPCVIESEEHSLRCADLIKTICDRHGINYVFKSSYDKANRSAGSSFRGPGLEKGLQILEKVRKEFDVPLVTDVHSPEEAKAVGEVCDVIQIPAFLCRQTDLIFSAAQTGAVVKVKKGQFMAPWDMKNVIEKIVSCHNENIILTDRGTSFGYNNLVVDMRGIQIMKELGFPVCFDASHAVQIPGGNGTSSGGQRQYLSSLAKAAIAAGANALFLEAHTDPSQAKSDKDSVWPIDQLEELLIQVKRVYEAVSPSYAV